MIVFAQILRRLRRSPGFTLAAIFIAALGIGVATALFSLVEGVLVRPLPYSQPGRLVWLNETYRSLPQVPFSLPDIRDAQARNHVFGAMAAYGAESVTLTGHGPARRLTALTVSHHYFQVLGIQPLAGRLFTAREADLAGAPAVLLSRSFWASRFGSDPRIMGRTVTLNGAPYSIAGVLPDGFALDLNAQFCLPLNLHAPNMDSRGNHPGLSVVARLRPGVSLARAQSEMSTIARQLAREYPRSNAGVGVAVVGLHRHLAGDLRQPLLLLIVAVGLLFLVACANLAGLLLARGLFRQREMAVRLALGASRGRLLRETLVECLLLAFAGGALGWWVAAAAQGLLAAALPDGIHIARPVAAGLPVLLAAALLALVAGMTFGLPPALQAASGDPAALLQSGGRASHPRAWRWQRRFVVAEVALTLVLLAASGLMLRGVTRLLHQPVGFDARGVLTAQLSLPAPPYTSPARRQAFISQLMDRLQHLPGVKAAGIVTPLPWPALWESSYAVEGVPAPASAVNRQVQMFVATPGYFRAMGIPLLAGRLPGPADAAQANSVVVSESFARRWWPGSSAIGHRIKLHTADYGQAGVPALTVNGVAGDVGVEAGAAPPLEVYLPVIQRAPATVAIALRTSLRDPLTLVPAVRGAVAAIDPAIPVYGAMRMRDRVAAAFSAQRLTLTALAAFAFAALTLAAVGLFGVISYLVGARRRETGIRMALGADGRAVRRMMLAQAARIAAWGIALGTAASLVAGRVLAATLFDVPARDGVTLAVVALLLFIVALAASWFPARRATRVDAIEVLRSE